MEVRSLAATDAASWHEPMLRAVSSSYRDVLAQREPLRAQISTLPETPHYQQSGRTRS